MDAAAKRAAAREALVHVAAVVTEYQAQIDQEEHAMTETTTTPILDALIASGTIWYEHDYLPIGRAADGTEVTLPGSSTRRQQTERYLLDFPTPADW